MVKILHHSSYIGYAGTERTAQLMCKYLSVDANCEVYLVYNELGYNPRLEHIARIAPNVKLVPFIEIAQKNAQPPYYPEDSNYADILAEIEPDVAHYHRSGYPSWPCHRTIHPAHTKIFETNIFGYADTQGHIDEHIYISHFIRNTAIRAGNSWGPVLYNPIEVPYIDIDYKDPWITGCFGDPDGPIDIVRRDDYKEHCKKKLGIDPNKIVLGRIGRPDNFSSISLDAFKVIQKQFGDSVVYYVVNPCDSWKKHAKKLRLKNVIWANPIYDDVTLSMTYAAFDIYAHARSDGECDPCNIGEAMMHCLPVVSHEGHTYQGQVEKLKDVGFVVPAKDNIAYAECLKELILNQTLRKEMGGVSQQKAFSTFEASLVIEILKEIYTNVLQ